jgi:hypothetical protein
MHELTPVRASRPPAEVAFAVRLVRETNAIGRRISSLADRLRSETTQPSVFARLKTLVSRSPDPPAGTDRDHPIDVLARRMSLSPFERDLLLLAGLPEQHEVFAAVLSALHPRGEPRPSVALAAQILCSSEDERLFLRESLDANRAPVGGAVKLVGDAPFYDRSLLIAPGLWSALHGLDTWPEGIRRAEPEPSLAGLRTWFEQPDVERCRRALASSSAHTILVSGDSEDIAFARAMALVARAGLRPIGLSVEGGTSEDFERVIAVHAMLRDAIPVLRLVSGEAGRAPFLPAFTDFAGPAVVAIKRGSVQPRGTRPIVSLSVERLSPTARIAMWRDVLPELDHEAEELAARYGLEPFQAVEVARDARSAGSLEDRAPSIDDVSASVRARSGLLVSPSVNLVRPRATWRDLVLPPDRIAQLREAVSRLAQQHRVLDEWGFLFGRPGARGVRMLLAGPPGTGKTLSAEILANALGVDLLAVDISRLVSKWIGETEKNLAEVFDVAERAQAVLLFDEADALFGKRTEVQDAHDRYANLETAYLLSRLERFEGLAVLSTNLKQNIDPAFLRRLEFALELDEPTLDDRERLWRHHIPRSAPLAADVDIAELASLYPIVGGLIRNAAVAAGFLAAADGTAITRIHFVHAIRREYEKAGRAFPGVPSGMSSLDLSKERTTCPPS